MPMIYQLVPRQIPSGLPGSESDNPNNNNFDIPSWVWVTLIIFIASALSCGFCARRKYRQHYLYRQELLHSGINRPPPILPFSRFGRPGFVDSTADIQRPPRVRRRGSQGSVISLPVYMERPGEREVVLLQRTGPKDNEIPPPASLDLPRPHPLSQAPVITSVPGRASSMDAQPLSSTSPPPARAQSTTAPIPTNPEGRSASPPPPFSETNPFNARYHT